MEPARLVVRLVTLTALLTLAASAVFVIRPRAVGAQDCMPDGQGCRTNQSCCGQVCVGSQPPGKRPMGVCCTPSSCAALGAQCGMVADGSCPDTLNCGGCPTDQTCTGNLCVTTQPMCTNIQPSLRPLSSAVPPGLLTVDASGTTSSCNSLADLRFFWTCISLLDNADCAAFVNALNADGNTHPQGTLNVVLFDAYTVTVKVCSANPPPPAICGPAISATYNGEPI